MLEESDLKPLLEALIMASSKPLTEENLLDFFSEEEKPSKALLRQTLQELQESYANRGIHLVELASGYQFQVEPKWHPWVGRLWEEKAPRYSRALFETLALIAYRQPITRGEIEDIRGVSLSPSIFKTLMEDREWIRIVGHREVPGRPSLYATTKNFLDYFGLKTLEQLPSLPEIMNIDAIKGLEEAEMPVASPENTQELCEMDSENGEHEDNEGDDTLDDMTLNDTDNDTDIEDIELEDNEFEDAEIEEEDADYRENDEVENGEIEVEDIEIEEHEFEAHEMDALKSEIDFEDINMNEDESEENEVELEEDEVALELSNSEKTEAEA